MCKLTKNSSFEGKSFELGLGLGKCQFSDFLNFLFLWARKLFFVVEYRNKTSSWTILPKKKRIQKWPFLDLSHWLTSLEKCQFFDFLNFLFL